MNKKELQELITALGVVAEASLIFMRIAITAGASREEAMMLTQSFIAAHIFRNKNAQEDKPNEQ